MTETTLRPCDYNGHTPAEPTAYQAKMGAWLCETFGLTVGDLERIIARLHAEGDRLHEVSA